MVRLPKREEILTIPNAMTITGGVLAWRGATRADTPSGLMQTGLARAIDTLDGTVARATNSESNVGALLDASTDKIVTSKYLLELYKKGLAPKAVIGSVALSSIINATSAAIAIEKDPELRPTKTGKLGLAAETVALLAFNSEHIARQGDRPGLARTCRNLGWTAFAVSVPLVAHAAKTYLEHAISHDQQ